MFQEFFKDTLISRFIKRLLRATDLPLYKFIREGDRIIQGCSYLYKDLLVSCEETGSFHFDYQSTIMPSNTLYPANDLLPGSSYGKYKLSKYDSDRKPYYQYHSRFMYYDTQTHEQLGEYLRLIRDRDGLNMLPYYNCYSARTARNLHLTSSDVAEGSSLKYKLLAIPVKYGQTYTIALDSLTQVILRPVIYTDANGFIESKNFDNSTSNLLYSSMNFKRPITVKIQEAANSRDFARERNLCLIIQVDVHNDSSITVLEGDYTSSWSNLQVDYSCDENLKFKNLALLHFNTTKSYAFSDRLIEYLLQAVITEYDTIDGNFGYAKDLLNIDYSTSMSTKNLWDNSIRSTIQGKQKAILKTDLIRDLDGYLNADIEQYLLTTKEVKNECINS